MCGIAGFLNRDGRPADPSTLERMSRLLGHRGPDGEGTYIDGAAALAHRRLAIIDLSEAARQPMANRDSSLIITLNGEIYNYVELMEELKRLGYAFISHSDTEVVLHAYEEWGEGAVDHFVGMWAFVIWDRKKRSFFCSRDRFGIKPFYYSLDKNLFIFGSEIKALVRSGRIERRPNERAVFKYLWKGYGYTDTSDETFFSGVLQLPPGHTMTISADRHELKRYWELPCTHRYPPVTYDQVKDEFLARIHDAVRLSLRSDVPVGIALSGGLDSTAIASIVALAASGNVETFSVCYDEEGFEERHYIDESLSRFRFKSHIIRPDPRALEKEFERIVWHQDEPYSGASVFSQWEVMKCARESGIKVLLTGQGGDEILAGYNKFYPYYFLDLVREGRVAELGRAFAKIGPASGFSRAGMARAMAKIALSRTVPGAWKRGVERAAFFCPRFLDRRFYEAEVGGSGLQGRCSSDVSFLGRELTASMSISPLPALLHIDDRNSMAHSVESRPPLLDHRLVEFLSALPSSLKMKDGQTKYLLREAFKGSMPESIRTRRDKMGFVTPARHWFRGEMKGFLTSVIGSDEFQKRGIFDPRGVGSILDEHVSGRIDHGFTLWSWVNLELWYRVCIEGDGYVVQG